MRPCRQTGAGKDLARVACCGKPRSRPAPDRVRAPPERPRPHQGEGLRQDEGVRLLSRGKSPMRCRFRLALTASPTTRREAQMPDKVTYYAVVNDLSSRERPAGVFRRTYTEDGGRSDEAFTRNLRWEYSTSLISAERGDLENEFIEITEDEAN